ncbi:MAG: MBOAT family O-acyltransferase [Eubacteriales bacterium]
MVFSSITFLFYFLPCILTLYFFSKNTWKNLVLVIGSLFFYAWGEPIYVILMIFSTIVDYSLGRFLSYAQLRKNIVLAKVCLFASVTINLSLLIIFKYSDLFLLTFNSVFHTTFSPLSLALPIGISFYTFQTMSYTIDVYRQKVPAQKNFLEFATYVTLFPQLIAGPIVRYETIAKELGNRKENLEAGIPLFIIGLSQKVLLANNIGLAFEEYQSGIILNPSLLSSWFLIFCYAMQIFFDFAGYSNMAIGLGLMFGFHFPINFNKPYLATSISNFWQRWHISLTTWFKEYVYIPLGGNRTGTFLTIRNIFTVWLLTGIWHGASWNFLFWGLYFALILTLEKFFILHLLKKLPIICSYLYTVIFLTIGWVLFAFESFSQIQTYFTYLLGANGFIDQSFYFLLLNYGIIALLCVLASTHLIRTIFLRLCRWELIKTFLYLMLFLASLAYIVDNSYDPFLYFRF